MSKQQRERVETILPTQQEIDESRAAVAALGSSSTALCGSKAPISGETCNRKAGHGDDHQHFNDAGELVSGWAKRPEENGAAVGNTPTSEQAVRKTKISRQMSDELQLMATIDREMSTLDDGAAGRVAAWFKSKYTSKFNSDPN